MRNAFAYAARNTPAGVPAGAKRLMAASAAGTGSGIRTGDDWIAWVQSYAIAYRNGHTDTLCKSDGATGPGGVADTGCRGVALAGDRGQVYRSGRGQNHRRGDVHTLCTDFMTAAYRTVILRLVG